MQRADAAPARCSRPDVLTGKQEGPGEGSLAPDAQCSAHGEDSTVAPLLASGFKRCARRGVVDARRQGQAPAALHAQASQGCQPTNNPDRVLSVEGRPPNGVSQWREPGTQRPGKCANRTTRRPQGFPFAESPPQPVRATGNSSPGAAGFRDHGRDCRLARTASDCRLARTAIVGWQTVLAPRTARCQPSTRTCLSQPGESGG